MLKSFSYSANDILDGGLCYLLWTEIEKLRKYFGKFCGQNTDEAMQRAFLHALTHFSEQKGDMTTYIKSLARDIVRDNGKLVFVDFLEQTLQSDSDVGSRPRVDVGNVSDFSCDIVANMDSDDSKMAEIVELALCYMDKFMLMCECLINNDTKSKYFPDAYTSSCLRIAKGCKNFNNMCISLYNSNKDGFMKFIRYSEKTDGRWDEANFYLVSQSESKKVRFLDERTGKQVEDPDTDRYRISGSIAGYRVLSVRYYDIWEEMCDYIDAEENNVMKFSIGSSFIVRTLGGSMTVVNPDLYNMYDLCRTEILSNILKDLGARYISIGSENFYLLMQEGGSTEIPDRVVRGVPISFEVLDITEKFKENRI